MKDSRLCPENLITRASQGIDAVRRDERLGTHLRQCRSCRRELSVAQAFHREFIEYVGIEDLAHRVAVAVGTELLRSNPVTPRRRRRSAGWYILAAALILVSVAAVAAYPTVRTLWRPSKSLANPSVAPVTLPNGRVAEHSEESPVDPAVATVPHDLQVDSLPVRRPAPTPMAASALGNPLPTARDLFAAANMARRENDGSRASSLYRELQRRYPTSAEALVSRVSFGRVLLDQLSDPASALAQFDGYLAQTVHTALAEEALFGRANALSQLGRPEAERETWRSLLARYPSSIYADRARIRIGGIQ